MPGYPTSPRGKRSDKPAGGPRGRDRFRKRFEPQGRISPKVALLARVVKRQYRLYLKLDGAGIPQLVVFINPPTKGIILTHMTGDELRVMRDFWNMAFDLAEPICDELDLQAKEAWEVGGDEFERLYRQPPLFLVRERAFSEHREGLPDGPAWLARVVGLATSGLLRVVPHRATVRSLSHAGTDEVVPEDDDAEDDEFEDMDAE